MTRGLSRCVLVLTAALAVSACQQDTGYVEIKTVPGAMTSPALYLNSEKLAPIRKGNAVLRTQVGTTHLAAEGFGGQIAPVCDIVVKKNRVTTVTLSVAERPLRCQCRFAEGAQPPARDAAAARVCQS